MDINEKQTFWKRLVNLVKFTKKPVELEIELIEFTDEVTPIAFSKVKLSEHFLQSDKECYSMRSKNRGVAFIVNIINFSSLSPKRVGAEQDKVNLVALFQQMGFVVMYYEDLTFQVCDYF